MHNSKCFRMHRIPSSDSLLSRDINIAYVVGYGLFFLQFNALIFAIVLPIPDTPNVVINACKYFSWSLLNGYSCTDYDYMLYIGAAITFGLFVVFVLLDVITFSARVKFHPSFARPVQTDNLFRHYLGTSSLSIISCIFIIPTISALGLALKKKVNFLYAFIVPAVVLIIIHARTLRVIRTFLFGGLFVWVTPNESHSRISLPAVSSQGQVRTPAGDIMEYIHRSEEPRNQLPPSLIPNYREPTPQQQQQILARPPGRRGGNQISNRVSPRSSPHVSPVRPSPASPAPVASQTASANIIGTANITENMAAVPHESLSLDRPAASRSPDRRHRIARRGRGLIPKKYNMLHLKLVSLIPPAWRRDTATAMSLGYLPEFQTDTISSRDMVAVSPTDTGADPNSLIESAVSSPLYRSADTREVRSERSERRRSPSRKRHQNSDRLRMVDRRSSYNSCFGCLRQVLHLGIMQGIFGTGREDSITCRGGWWTDSTVDRLALPRDSVLTVRLRAKDIPQSFTGNGHRAPAGSDLISSKILAIYRRVRIRDFFSLRFPFFYGKHLVGLDATENEDATSTVVGVMRFLFADVPLNASVIEAIHLSLSDFLTLTAPHQHLTVTCQADERMPRATIQLYTLIDYIGGSLVSLHDCSFTMEESKVIFMRPLLMFFAAALAFICGFSMDVGDMNSNQSESSSMDSSATDSSLVSYFGFLSGGEAHRWTTLFALATGFAFWFGLVMLIKPFANRVESFLASFVPFVLSLQTLLLGTFVIRSSKNFAETAHVESNILNTSIVSFWIGIIGMILLLVYLIALLAVRSSSFFSRLRGLPNAIFLFKSLQNRPKILWPEVVLQDARLRTVHDAAVGLTRLNPQKRGQVVEAAHQSIVNFTNEFVPLSLDHPIRQVSSYLCPHAPVRSEGTGLLAGERRADEQSSSSNLDQELIIVDRIALDFDSLDAEATANATRALIRAPQTSAATTNGCLSPTSGADQFSPITSPSVRNSSSHHHSSVSDLHKSLLTSNYRISLRLHVSSNPIQTSKDFQSVKLPEGYSGRGSSAVPVGIPRFSHFIHVSEFATAACDSSNDGRPSDLPEPVGISEFHVSSNMTSTSGTAVVGRKPCLAFGASFSPRCSSDLNIFIGEHLAICNLSSSRILHAARKKVSLRLKHVISEIRDSVVAAAAADSESSSSEAEVFMSPRNQPAISSAHAILVSEGQHALPTSLSDQSENEDNNNYITPSPIAISLSPPPNNISSKEDVPSPLTRLNIQPASRGVSPSAVRIRNFLRASDIGPVFALFIPSSNRISPSHSVSQLQQKWKVSNSPSTTSPAVLPHRINTPSHSVAPLIGHRDLDFSTVTCIIGEFVLRLDAPVTIRRSLNDLAAPMRRDLCFEPRVVEIFTLSSDDDNSELDLSGTDSTILLKDFPFFKAASTTGFAHDSILEALRCQQGDVKLMPNTQKRNYTNSSVLSSDMPNSFCNKDKNTTRDGYFLSEFSAVM